MSPSLPDEMLIYIVSAGGDDEASILPSKAPRVERHHQEHLFFLDQHGIESSNRLPFEDEIIESRGQREAPILHQQRFLSPFRYY